MNRGRPPTQAERRSVPANWGLWVTPVAWLPGGEEPHPFMTLPPGRQDIPDANRGMSYDNYRQRRVRNYGQGINMAHAVARDAWATASGENVGLYGVMARGPGTTLGAFTNGFLTRRAMPNFVPATGAVGDDPAAHLHRHYWKMGNTIADAPAAAGWLARYYRRLGPNRMIRSQMYRVANIRKHREDRTLFYVASQRRQGTYYRVKRIPPRGRRTSFNLCTCPDWVRWNQAWYERMMQRPQNRGGRRRTAAAPDRQADWGVNTQRATTGEYRHCKHTLAVENFKDDPALQTLTNEEQNFMDNMEERTRVPDAPPPAIAPGPGPQPNVYADGMGGGIVDDDAFDVDMMPDDFGFGGMEIRAVEPWHRDMDDPLYLPPPPPPLPGFGMGPGVMGYPPQPPPRAPLVIPRPPPVAPRRRAGFFGQPRGPPAPPFAPGFGPPGIAAWRQNLPIGEALRLPAPNMQPVPGQIANLGFQGFVRPRRQRRRNDEQFEGLFGEQLDFPENMQRQYEDDPDDREFQGGFGPDVGYDDDDDGFAGLL